MLFLKINNADLSFGEKLLMWKFYTTNKILLTIEYIQIVDQKEFVIIALDMDNKTFVLYMAIKKQEKISMHLEK